MIKWKFWDHKMHAVFNFTCYIMGSLTLWGQFIVNHWFLIVNKSAGQIPSTTRSECFNSTIQQKKYLFTSWYHKISWLKTHRSSFIATNQKDHWHSSFQIHAIILPSPLNWMELSLLFLINFYSPNHAWCQTSRALAISLHLFHKPYICFRSHILESLPYIGTAASVEIMIEKILKNEVDPEVTKNWLTSLSFIPRYDDYYFQ